MQVKRERELEQERMNWNHVTHHFVAKTRLQASPPVGGLLSRIRTLGHGPSFIRNTTFFTSHKGTPRNRPLFLVPMVSAYGRFEVTTLSRDHSSLYSSLTVARLGSHLTDQLLEPELGIPGEIFSINK